MIEQEVTNSLRGDIGETLMRGHKGAIQQNMTDRLLEILDDKWVPEDEYRLTFRIKSTPYSYDVYLNGDYASWRPDALYSLRFNPDYGVHSFSQYVVEFPVEIKTGQYAELTDNQRAVMETISRKDDPSFRSECESILKIYQRSLSTLCRLLHQTGRSSIQLKIKRT